MLDSSKHRCARRLRSLALAVLLAAGIQAALGSCARAADMLAAGAAFPAWELSDHTGAKRSSSEMAGKRYLMWFFPKAMTPGCTTEGRGMRDSYADFEKLGVAVFGVSADDASSNAAFVEAESFPFPLLSDPNLELASKVGASGALSLLGYARRVSYLVGADGNVEKAYGEVDPATHAKQVLGDAAPKAPAQPANEAPTN